MEGGNNHIINLLLSGCDLAKRFESELSIMPPLSQHDLAQKCDEIIRCFSLAKEQINLSMHPPSFDYQHQLDVGAIFGRGNVVADVSMNAESSGQDRQRGTIEVGGSSSSAQPKTSRRSSRNEDQEGNKRVKVAAPQIGNTEMPPEDGFTWRKYGQKEILNAQYPRSYYRCTHQKLYNCPAKKQVQRLDEDPLTFDILYRGKHTCHNSNTAPSIPPPSSSTIQDMFLSQLPISTVGSPSFPWLSIDPPRASTEGAAGTWFDPQQQQEQQMFRVSSSNSVLSDQNGRENQAVDLLNNNHPMLDWNEMFHSGSSSSNSMEVIFPTADNKKD